MNEISRTQRLTATAFLAASGIALFVIESYIPTPLPFLKIGLANTLSVIALFMLGNREMFALVVLRVIVGSLFMGAFMSPSFAVGMSAGLASAGIMSIANQAAKNIFSPLGISLLGSFAHVVAQILVVRYVYEQDSTVLYMLPLLFLSALVGGIIVGLISLRLLMPPKEIHE